MQQPSTMPVAIRVQLTANINRSEVLDQNVVVREAPPLVPAGTPPGFYAGRSVHYWITVEGSPFSIPFSGDYAFVRHALISDEQEVADGFAWVHIDDYLEQQASMGNDFFRDWISIVYDRRAQGFISILPYMEMYVDKLFRTAPFDLLY